MSAQDPWAVQAFQGNMPVPPVPAFLSPKTHTGPQFNCFMSLTSLI